MLDIQVPEPGQIGASVRFPLSSPELSPEDAEQIRQLVYRHKLVVMRGLSLTTREYVDFSRNFGVPQIYFQPNYHHPEHPEIFVSSNVPYKGAKFGVAGTGRYWHTDYQFFEQPLPMTMLSPQVFAASARQTSYIDMERVLERLPPHLLREVEGRDAQHDPKMRYKIQATDIDKSVAEVIDEITRIAPPVWHPAVVEHPITGKRLLYISPGFTVALSGLTYEENQRVLGELFEFIERPEHIYTHTWQEGDVLLWENRSLLHRASEIGPGESSVSFRIGIYDGASFYAGLEPWNGEQGEHHAGC